MPRLYQRQENVMVAEIGGQSRITLNRNYHVSHYLCCLEVTHTNGENPVFNDENLFSLIQKLEIVGNGNQNLKSIRGSKLKLNTVLGFTTQSKKKLDTTASETVTSKVWFTVMFNINGVIRPHDTILNTALYTNLDMLVDFAGADSIGTDITVTSAKINTYSTALIGYKRGAGETIKYYKEIQTVEPIVNTADEHTITLPINKEYKQLTLVSISDGVRVDTIIEHV
jgi:hypothetical protein